MPGPSVEPRVQRQGGSHAAAAWPPHEDAATDQDDGEHDRADPGDAAHDLVFADAKDVELLDRAEHAAVAGALAQHPARARVQVDVFLRVGESDARRRNPWRVLARRGETDVVERPSAVKRPGVVGEPGKRRALAAGRNGEQLLVEDRLKGRPEEVDGARDGHHQDDQADRQAGPAMHLENALAQIESHGGGPGRDCAIASVTL